MSCQFHRSCRSINVSFYFLKKIKRIVMISRVQIVLLLLSAVAMVHAASRPNDLIVGARVPGDYVIQREPVEKSSSILQIVKLKKTFTGNNYSKITQVKLLDQNKNGNGATASVINGGPGSSFVTVDFKSKRGHSIKFIVELYGR